MLRQVLLAVAERTAATADRLEASAGRARRAAASRAPRMPVVVMLVGGDVTARAPLGLSCAARRGGRSPSRPSHRLPGQPGDVLSTLSKGTVSRVFGYWEDPGNSCGSSGFIHNRPVAVCSSPASVARRALFTQRSVRPFTPEPSWASTGQPAGQTAARPRRNRGNAFSSVTRCGACRLQLRAAGRPRGPAPVKPPLAAAGLRRAKPPARAAGSRAARRCSCSSFARSGARFAVSTSALHGASELRPVRWEAARVS